MRIVGLGLDGKQERPRHDLYQDAMDDVSPLDLDPIAGVQADMLRLNSLVNAGRLPLVNRAALDNVFGYIDLQKLPSFPVGMNRSALVMQGLLTTPENPTLAGRLTAHMLGYRLLPILLADVLNYQSILSVVVDRPALEIISGEQTKRQAEALAKLRVEQESHFYGSIGYSNRVKVVLSSTVDQEAEFRKIRAEVQKILSSEQSPLSESDRSANSFGYFTYQTALTFYLQSRAVANPSEFPGPFYVKFGAAGSGTSDRSEVRFDQAQNFVQPSIMPVYGHLGLNVVGNGFAPYLGDNRMKNEMPLFGPESNMVAFFKKSVGVGNRTKKPNWFESLSTQVSVFEDIAGKYLTGNNYPESINDAVLSPYGVTTRELGIENNHGAINISLQTYYLLALKLDYINRHHAVAPSERSQLISDLRVNSR
jgi:hypothetical protein